MFFIGPFETLLMFFMGSYLLLIIFTPFQAKTPARASINETFHKYRYSIFRLKGYVHPYDHFTSKIKLILERLNTLLPPSQLFYYLF